MSLSTRSYGDTKNIARIANEISERTTVQKLRKHTLYKHVQKHADRGGAK